ncbi:SMP-30/gluconolactonase/LRE family protein [Brevibacillus choshinensis]|uniref:SMP-30/gluconolactonase/LRE family protein n=1 Tax=Brevibacillus choshinensis TaxID=54911 RepID=A0ABX7FKN0_BRECH|nr:SMP-30/gluconolactonase/LRE family protein [Brevibacillus choshinensis]QRG66781.1 SMP-30/gluconolactonase/LRE family protein [Brevibacillus choshinensis]
MKQLKHTIRMASLMIGLLAVPAAAATPALAEVSRQPDKPAPSFVTMAGNGYFGEDNGAAQSASFRTPMGIVLHPDGSVYIADTKSHLIRKLFQGNISTYAGFTFSKDPSGLPIGTLFDGSANLSVFQEPQGLALDSQGNLYVADSGNHSIRKIDAQGVRTIGGDGVMGSRDGNTGKDARFHSPADLAVAADGTVYVSDTLNHVIRKIAVDGTVTTLNSPSERVVELSPGDVETAGDFQDGPLETAKFNEPSGICLDAKGNLYVSDTGNQRIRYIDLQQKTVTTVAGQTSNTYAPGNLYMDGGNTDGDAATAQFQFPRGIALTAEGGLVVADSLNHAVRYLHDGKVTTLTSASSPPLQLPVDVAVDPDGAIWIVDAFGNAIMQMQANQKDAGK